MSKSKHITIFVLIFTTHLLGGQLSGKISDSTNSPISNVHILLFGQGPTTYIDSTSSDSIGNYSLLGFPIGSYRLQLDKNGFMSIDTSLVLSDGNQVANFFLKTLLGTEHKGNVSGVWLESDNPHIITGDINIVDSLYIAPGCTVENLSGNTMYFFTDGNLKVGQSTSKRTMLANLTIVSQNKGSQDISIINSQLANCRINLQGNHILFDSVRCNFSELINTSINCDNLVLNNSSFTGKTEIQYPSRTVVPSFYLEVASTKASMSNCIFDMLPVEFRNCDSLNVSYCCFNKDYSLLSIMHLESNINISHSNISILSLYHLGSFAIADCIIDSVSFFAMTNITYDSPFTHCIIQSISHNPIFGLLQSIRENINNDSCDLWYNIKTDPLFSAPPALKTLSPAIGAASDNLNIGYYQGSGDFIKYNRQNGGSHSAPLIRVVSRKPLAISLNTNASANIRGFNSLGKLLFEQKSFGTSIIYLREVPKTTNVYLLEISFGATRETFRLLAY